MCPTIYILSKNYCATLRSMNRWIMLNRGRQNHHLYLCVSWNRGWLYVSNIFEPVSFVFCAASFILRPDSFMFRRRLSVFKLYELGAIFIYFPPFSNSFVGDFLPKCAKRNFEAESGRARADLSFYLCPPNFRPSPSHHPMVWLSVTIQWFWSG